MTVTAAPYRVHCAGTDATTLGYLLADERADRFVALGHDAIGRPQWEDRMTEWMAARYQGALDWTFEPLDAAEARSLLARARVTPPGARELEATRRRAVAIRATTMAIAGRPIPAGPTSAIIDSFGGERPEVGYFRRIADGGLVVRAEWSAPPMGVVSARAVTEGERRTWVRDDSMPDGVQGGLDADFEAISAAELARSAAARGLHPPTDHELKLLHRAVGALDEPYRLVLGVDLGAVVRLEEAREVKGAIGVLANVGRAQERGTEVHVVAVCDEATEPHVRRTLDALDLYDRTGMPRAHLHLCREGAAKAPIARALGLTAFVDGDRDALEAMEGIVAHRLHLDPTSSPAGRSDPTAGIRRVSSWRGVVAETPLPPIRLEARVAASPNDALTRVVR